MAELTPQERLQPSLLDRLTDDEPDRLQESREKRVLSMSRLRECVLRDLAWLFNATRIADREEIERYPFAAHSVRAQLPRTFFKASNTTLMASAPMLSWCLS